MNKADKRFHFTAPSRQIIVFCLMLPLLLTIYAWGQSSPAYVVMLTDKPDYTAQLSAHAFLSPRAIAHRLRYNIPIVFEDYPVCKTYIERIVQAGAVVDVLARSKWFNCVVITTDSATLDSIACLPFVRQIFDIYNINYDVLSKGKDFGQFPSFPCAPDIPFEDPFSDASYYGLMYEQIHIHRGQFLHDLGYKGEDMLIAVIDGGFIGLDSHAHFADLHQSGRFAGYYDFAHEFSSALHGSEVMSVMSSHAEGDAVGTAPMATYAALKSEAIEYEDILEEFFLVAAAECADSLGADVANISLGYAEFDYGRSHLFSDLDGKHSAASMATALLVKKGCVTVVAAGNMGTKQWHYISAPADSPNVLSVAAVNVEKEVAGFSSRGSSVFSSYKPDVAAVGQGTFVFSSDISSLRLSNGTSYAAPVIAGLAACLRQAFASRTSFEIISAIRQSGDRAGNPDTLSGYGIPDFVRAYRILSAVQNEKTSSEKFDMHIFPNPVRDRAGIMLAARLREQEEHYAVQLTDALGSILETNRLQNGATILDMSVYPQGIYFIRLLMGNVVMTSSKIVKIHE
jgi:hypothetical protein